MGINEKRAVYGINDIIWDIGDIKGVVREE